MSTMHQGPLTPPGVEPSNKPGNPPLEGTVVTLYETLKVTSHGVPLEVWGPIVDHVQKSLGLPTGSSVEVKPGPDGETVYHIVRPQFGPVRVYGGGGGTIY